MMISVRTTAALGCLVLAGLAGPTAAQASGWYAGAGAGRSGSSVDDDRIQNGLMNQGLDITGWAADERDTAWRLFGGYQFHPHFAVEGGWFELGRFGYAASTFPDGQLSGDVRMRGLNLDLVGTWPLTERLSLLGRLGVVHAQARGRFSAGGAVSNPYGTTGVTERDWGFKVGAGVGWQLTPAWQLRLEAERYRIHDSVGNRGHVDVASISLVYRFGASASGTAGTAAPVGTAVAPSQPGASTRATPATPGTSATPGTAQTQPPQPAGPAGAATPPLTRVQFSADALFDFDSAELRPEGRRQLDAFVQQLRGVRVDGVEVVGHADRIGSKAYNQKLSERRAAAVEAYLVQAGVAGGSIRSRGAGEDQPITTPSDCRSTLPVAALVVCLQPDRRVEVEATGTR